MTAATTERFRPSRMGIVGLYEYADQEFAAEDGRLALRGRNTSGKSKALELLIPFVLDGDITPRKLDPFASSAKTMRWNLIECTDPYEGRRSNKRIGYAWAEFRRPGSGGDPDEFFTCGIGLEATRSTDGVRDRWYFTTSQRVGADLHLTRAAVGDDDAAQPIGKGELTEQLHTGGGALHAGVAAYREALRAQLLPFATTQLYEQTLDVVRLLRKPKLSDSLDAKGLSKMLSGALPAVDESLVRRLGDALEQLHELQRQHDELSDARLEVASITEREYRSYARGVVSVRADRLRQAETGHERARAQVRAATDGLETACAARDAHDAARVQLDRDHARVDGEYLELIQSDAFKVIAVLEDREREHAACGERVQRAAEALARTDAQVQQASAAADSAQQRHTAATAALAALVTELGELLRSVGLEPAAPDRAVLAALPGRLAVRRQDVDRASELVEELARATMRLQTIDEPLAQASAGRDRAGATAAEASAQLDQAIEQHLDALRAWQQHLRELAVGDGDLDAIADAAIDGSEDVSAVLAHVAAPRETELALAVARVTAQREAASAEAQVAGERVAALERERDPRPEPRGVRVPDRAGRAGAPLWAACDFRDAVPDEDRAALEAALEDAGLLDAWISPDGLIHDADVTLAVDGECVGDARTLADLLVVDPAAHGVSAATVEAVLRSLPLDGVVGVAPGRFRFGPLHGRSAKAEPEFIGAAARAARRERLLAQARAHLAACEEHLGALDAQIEQLDAAARQLADERRALPAIDAVRSAQEAQRRAALRLDAAEAELARLITARDEAQRAQAAAADALGVHARDTGLACDRAGLRAAGEALSRAELAGDRVAPAIDDIASAATTHEGALAGVAAGREAQDAARVDHERATTELDGAHGRLRAAQAADGATAQELAERAGRLRADRERLDRERRGTELAQRAAHGAVKDAELAAERAEEAVHAAEAERTGALDGVRVLGAHDLLSAALGSDAAPEDERASSTWTLTTALDRVRALPALDERADLGKRASKVGEAVSRLQRKLSAFDMNAATYSQDDITLVEITREGRRTTPTAMLRELDGDLEHREQILSAKRREVLGRALLGEIAEHLRMRIGAVRASIRARNETLRRCPTGAGRTVSLSWDVDEDAGAPAGVLALLGDRATEHLADADRDALFDFLQDRIAQARAGAADEAAQTAIVDHLAVALDYRRWWRFTLHLHERDGSSRRLTARTQGLGSGGEQSVLMHLPLFATAAQLYDLAPGGPRIIALDEAMDGIDPPTREQMFALLVALDLDWVMTSYDINPCVATVPRVGFYELHRDNSEWGVWAQHFVWDGEQVTELVDG